MAEELKELLEKIQREGVDAADERSRQIESQARRHAEEIVEKAKKEADRILSDARSSAARAEEGGRQSLKQAARDTLISLRKEISAMLDRIIVSHVHKSLGTEELSAMLLSLVKESGCGNKEKTVISMKKDDLEKIEKSFLDELSVEVKKGIILKAAPDIKSGFTISYDSGKSYYDFTDQALAEFIASYLKPHLGKILEAAAASKA